jgi:redox-sensitive bicupin YhaK (pirin superfamily)
MTQAAISIEGKPRDLGDGFFVRRLLPHLQARHVGPFVFFDHMGPADFPVGGGIDVRPHPHIGLATVSWLFEGAIRHRDSLDSLVDIHPGDVNWMTAGRGIVHSERTPPDVRTQAHRLHGIQVWVALPTADEETEPHFAHHPAASLPSFEHAGAQLTLIAGNAYDRESPVRVFAPMYFLQARIPAGTRLPMPAGHLEHGVYVVEGQLEFAGVAVAPGAMAVQFGGQVPAISVQEDALVMLFGGAPLDGERHLWWNFVSTSKERIEVAKRDWSAGTIGTVPGDEEFIPLPEY